MEEVKPNKIYSFSVEELTTNCLTPCQHIENIMVASVACKTCKNFIFLDDINNFVACKGEDL